MIKTLTTTVIEKNWTKLILGIQNEGQKPDKEIKQVKNDESPQQQIKTPKQLRSHIYSLFLFQMNWGENNTVGYSFYLNS